MLEVLIDLDSWRSCLKCHSVSIILLTCLLHQHTLKYVHGLWALCLNLLTCLINLYFRHTLDFHVRHQFQSMLLQWYANQICSFLLEELFHEVILYDSINLHKDCVEDLWVQLCKSVRILILLLILVLCKLFLDASHVILGKQTLNLLLWFQLSVSFVVFRLITRRHRQVYLLCYWAFIKRVFAFFKIYMVQLILKLLFKNP